MKKFIVAILALVMLLSIAATAGAMTNNFTIYNVPCREIADDELYQYHGNGFVTKGNDNHTVQIRHSVTQTSAIENNRIAAYREDTRKTMGASWKPADNREYPVTSGAIERNKRYTGAGRGNTNYDTKYDINKITITGVINSWEK